LKSCPLAILRSWGPLRVSLPMSSKSNRQGAPCPPYCYCSIAAMFRRYEKELVGTYVQNPLGTRVWFMDYNFPKLVQLKFRGNKARAQRAIAHLRAHNPDESEYECDSNRFSTLFWIPDIIIDPDSIHDNAHGTIEGDIVYVKRYAKAGSDFKLVFTTVDEELNQRVVTTSFLSQENRLGQFVKTPARWVRKPKREQSPPEGNLPFTEQKK